MADMNLKEDFKHIHFIGIGGISMSGLAFTLHNKGATVTGSDTKESPLTSKLAGMGMKITIGQKAENIEPGTDLVVYTAAVKADNPELCAAMAKNIPCIDRAELMGLIMQDFPYPVCVAGTHGKTTTTAMITSIFLAAHKDPTINLGGVLPAIGSNVRVGGDQYFIGEACEYFDSFLKFYPHTAVILNVEAEHLDYFKDLAHIEASFHGFAKNIKPEGTLVINDQISGLTSITQGVTCRIETFGSPQADWTAKNIAFDENGHASFTVCYKDQRVMDLKLKLTGEHNILNALAAVAVARSFQIEPQDIQAGLAQFTGAKRRYEFKGVVNGITVVDDYAHHPTEIAATLKAAKNTPHNRLFVVFQPHTYTRTHLLRKELAQSFDLADGVLVVDIYAAREKDTGLVHSRDLVEDLKNRGINAHYCANFESVEKYLFEQGVPGDLLITMGAGDVYLMGEALLPATLSTLSQEN